MKKISFYLALLVTGFMMVSCNQQQPPRRDCNMAECNCGDQCGCSSKCPCKCK